MQLKVSPVWTPSLEESEQNRKEQQRKHDQALQEHIEILRSRLSTDQDLKESINALWGIKVIRLDKPGQYYIRIHSLGCSTDTFVTD